MNELKKKENAALQDFMKIYEERYPGIMRKNIELQDKALQRINETIDEADAVQAATIYKVLTDKANANMKARGGSDNTQNTINMFFGDSNINESIDILTTVSSRMKKEKQAIIDSQKKKKVIDTTPAESVNEEKNIERKYTGHEGDVIDEKFGEQVIAECEKDKEKVESEDWQF